MNKHPNLAATVLTVMFLAAFAVVVYFPVVFVLLAVLAFIGLVWSTARGLVGYWL